MFLPDLVTWKGWGVTFGFGSGGGVLIVLARCPGLRCSVTRFDVSVSRLKSAVSIFGTIPVSEGFFHGSCWMTLVARWSLRGGSGASYWMTLVGLEGLAG